MLEQLVKIKKELNNLADKKQAVILQRFFKTGIGEYGESDVFLGIKVPKQREVAKKYKDLSLPDVKMLLQSKVHEHRLTAVIILVNQFRKGNDENKEKIFKFYLKNTKYINNWDLVDLSAHYIVGEWLMDKPRDILYKLAKSNLLWERRIAVVSTFAFIRNNDFKDIKKLSVALLTDKHNLMHKAVGWMLREMGKRDIKVLTNFLDKYTLQMPRTSLRYAIERLPEKKRLYYLHLK